MATKKITWTDIKSAISSYDKDGLIRLVGDLYSSSTENKRFLESRCIPSPDRLTPYKKIITDAIYPNTNKPIRLSVGKKAISDYKKATNDEVGVIELMVHYLECGNNFTVEYGDIDEPFYDSLESMFKSILAALYKSTQETRDMFISRLEDVVDNAKGIGWGYYDGIADMLEEFLDEINGHQDDD